MRKFSILFFVLTLVLSACSSDDSPLETSGNIVGTWIGVDVDYTGTSETTASGETIKATFVGESYDANYSLIFTENPNEVISEGTYSLKLTTKVSEQTQVSNSENLTFLNSGTWDKVGDQLTIVGDGQTSTATILELTDTTLKIEINETQSVSAQDVTVKYVIDVIATYTRQ